MKRRLSEELSKLKNRRVLVMFSGGKDSALCLYLLKKHGAFVEALHFRHRWSWELSTNEAKKLARQLDANLLIEDYTEKLKARLENFRDGRPCKFCKPGMYIRALEYAKTNGFEFICIGDNASDTIVIRLAQHERLVGNHNLYFTRYLDSILEGIEISESVQIFRPLIYLTAGEVGKKLKDASIEVKRNHETGDKYFEYWREGCPIQYNEPGAVLTEERMDRLYVYNVLATEIARQKGFRASVHLPSTKIVTVPEGHENEVRDYLISRGERIGTSFQQKERRIPFIEHFIIEVYGIDPDLLIDCERTLPLVNRLIERAELRVVGDIHHNFEPFGNTMVFILSNSHLAVHTWPENEFIHFDLLSCQALPEQSRFEHIIFEIFKTKNFNIRKLRYQDDSQTDD
ncbi:MAG: hypothetical protein DRP09_16815 [Candidatus Thorarchaeota archaeon]|nr:MAG: hypothetical protein DRP09_16815 [Candidatus Thorarchaeota archaeon]